jgi:hypothetical protein
MTDNEIVKALEDAIKIGDAPIGKNFGCIISKLTAKETVDLINRLQAENERLNTKIKSIYKELERISLMTVETDRKELAGEDK